jgi:hypothetical protein
MGRSELHVSLIVTSQSLSPEEISSLLGLQPTKVWHMGAPLFASSARNASANVWKLMAGGPQEQLTATPLFDELIAVIRNHRDRFAMLPDDAECELQCAAYFREQTPGISLSPDHVKALAAIGASVDIDLYRLPVRGDGG